MQDGIELKRQFENQSIILEEWSISLEGFWKIDLKHVEFTWGSRKAS